MLPPASCSVDPWLSSSGQALETGFLHGHCAPEASHHFHFSSHLSRSLHLTEKLRASKIYKKIQTKKYKSKKNIQVFFFKKSKHKIDPFALLNKSFQRRERRKAERRDPWSRVPSRREVSLSTGKWSQVTVLAQRWQEAPAGAAGILCALLFLLKNLRCLIGNLALVAEERELAVIVSMGQCL